MKAEIEINAISTEPIDGMPAFSATTSLEDPEQGYVILQGDYLEINSQLYSYIGKITFGIEDENIELQLERVIEGINISKISLKPGAVSLNDLHQGVRSVLVESHT